MKGRPLPRPSKFWPPHIRGQGATHMEKAMGKKEATKTRDADEIIKAAKLDASRLIGDTGDFFLSNMKAARHLKPWDELDEERQKEMCEQARHQAIALVSGIVEAIAAAGLPAIPAKLSGGSFKIGDGTVDLKCSVAFDQENAKRLAGGTVDVMLVFASPSQYDSPMNSKPEPNQPELRADDEDEEAEHDEETGEVLEDA